MIIIRQNISHPILTQSAPTDIPPQLPEKLLMHIYESLPQMYLNDVLLVLRSLANSKFIWTHFAHPFRQRMLMVLNHYFFMMTAENIVDCLSSIGRLQNHYMLSHITPKGIDIVCISRLWLKEEE